jgi:thioredoxin reductase (NADPH)
MLTSEQIRAIPIFSGLSEALLQRIADTCADVHLAPGEFAVHEGGERAFYAVVQGRIEVVKRVEGGERTIGWRAPGQVFGEIPIVFGVPFQGGFRAAEPSRVLHMDPRQYFDIAAAAPEVPVKLGAMAQERIGGLQGLAAQAPKPLITILSQRWDPACGDLRRFLTRNQITFDWLKPESPELEKLWPAPRPAEADWPAMRLNDGTVICKPQAREVAQFAGLQTAPKLAEYDTLIVGGGPAGMAAAVYGASEGLRTLVVEREAPGGQAGTSSRIENYLGFPSGVSGDELASRALLQAKRLGAEILVTRSVTAFDPVRGEAVLDGIEIVRTRTVILATGVTWRRLEVEGFDKLLGKGIYYGAARSEAAGTHGEDIHLIGAGNSAGQAAMHFANHARTVTLVVRGDSLEKSMSHYLVEQLRAKSNIRVKLQSEVAAVYGERNLSTIDLRNRAAGTVERHDCGGLFVFIGADADTGWLPADLARDAKGYVLTGDDVVKAGRWSRDRDPFLLETSVPGVFACGDVRLSPVKRVASAVGEGSMAIALVHQYLAREGRAPQRAG